MISGYLITLLLIGEHERTGRVSLREFWTRRARRLLPALFTMLAALVTSTPRCSSATQLGRLRGDVHRRPGVRVELVPDLGRPGLHARRSTSPRCATCGAWPSRSSSTSCWPLVMIGLISPRAPAAAADGRVAGRSPPSLITVVDGAAVLPGPDRALPESTPDAYWTRRRALHQQDRHAVPVDDHPGDRAAARCGVRHGLAPGGGDARAAARQGAPARPARPGSRLGVLVVLALSLHIVTARRRRRLRGCSAAGSSLVDVATLVVIAAVTHRRASAGRLLGTPIAGVDRHPVLRAVPVPLADLPDHPRRVRGGARAWPSSWWRWPSRSSSPRSRTASSRRRSAAAACRCGGTACVTATTSPAGGPSPRSGWW